MIESKLFAMTIIGSMIFLFWYIFSKKTEISYELKRKFLIIVTISFLIPFPIWKNNYLYVLYQLFGYERIHTKEIVEVRHMLYRTSDGKLYNLGVEQYILMTLFCIWLMVVIVLLLKQIKRYRKLCLLWQNAVFEPISEIEKNIVEEERKRQKIKRNIYAKKIYGIKSPMTIGFFKPTIFLPMVEMKQEDILLIVRHEMIHIKKKDYILKIIGISVAIMHWFNPLSYILIKQINKICEFHCDEQVILTLNDEKDRKRYSYLLLYSSQKENNTTSLFLPVNYFGSNEKKRMNERLEKMKKAKKRTKWQVVTTIGVITMSMMVSSVGVLAYQEAPVMNVEVYEPLEEGVQTYKMPEGMQLPGTPMLPEFQLVEGYENYIIYEDGTVKPVYDNKTIKSGCSHTYKNITYTEHKKNGSGCVVTVYSAQECSRCGAVKNKEEQYSTTYKKCPH